MAAAALVVLALALRGPAASACSNDYECSLNGVCKAGACACDVPWTGAACAMIGFDPAPAGGMYGFGVPFATSSWGGNALEDGGLFVEPTGQGIFPLFAESETDFFLRVVNAQVSFTKNDTGEVTGLVLHQGGRDQPAPKAR